MEKEIKKNYTCIANVNDLNREEWLKIRKAYIGGSDAAAAVGLNPWRSPLSVYMDKTTDEIKSIDNLHMKLGRYLEDTVVRLFEEETGKKTRRNNQMMVDNNYPFMLADIDREVVGENAILECKTTSSWNRDQWQDGQAPVQYEIQCHHYMAVTGAEKCYLACLIGLQDFVIREIDRDEETIRLLRQYEGDFWKQVKSGELPDPDGSKDYSEALKERYQGRDNDSIDLRDLEEVDMNYYFDLDKSIKGLQMQQEMMKQKIQKAMGEHQGAVLKGAKVTWKPYVTSRFDGKKFKNDEPELYEQYSKQSESRRFVIKQVEEEEEGE